MNEIILKNMNSIVKEDDTLIILGDICAGLKKRYQEQEELLKKFNGNKILILGNHDHNSTEFYEKCGYTVGTHLQIKDYFLNHYPLDDNSQQSLKKIFIESKCKKIIHGHKHTGETKNDGIQRLNVCVDYWDFKPVLFKP